jgi:hypothetical protein
LTGLTDFENFYTKLTKNKSNFLKCNSTLKIKYGRRGDSAVIWTSQITPKFFMQGVSRARNLNKKASIVGN